MYLWNKRFLFGALAISALVIFGGCAPQQTEREAADQEETTTTKTEETDHGTPTVFPTTIPNITQGKVVYDRECAKCHGAKGDGKGPGGAGLEKPPANFTDKAFVRRHRPDDFFGSVTDGLRGMPAFKSSVSEEDRWNVTYYLRLFATSDAEIAAGKVIYDKSCAICHGAGGKGDGSAGAALTPKPANFTDQSFQARHADNAFFEVISKGEGPMPAFESSLSEEEQRQVLDYERSFGYVK